MELINMKTYNILKALMEKPISKTRVARVTKCLWESIHNQMNMLIDKECITYKKQGREVIVSITKKGEKLYKDLKTFFDDGGKK